MILPGQVFDGQAGLHANVFRDYDPAVGRYPQSDPIGLPFCDVTAGKQTIVHAIHTSADMERLLFVLRSGGESARSALSVLMIYP